MRRPAPPMRVFACGILLSAALVACGALPSQPTPTLAPTATLSLPPADETAFAFLQAWQRQDYAAMYSLLSPTAQAATSEDRFTLAYQEVMALAYIQAVAPRILAAYQPGSQAEVSFAVRFQTAVVGEFEVQNQMNLSYAGGRWGVDWSRAQIFPQLGDGTFVRFESRVPSRGNIYDRNGLGLAVQGEAVEVGVVPARIQDEPTLLAQLSSVLGMAPDDIRSLYASARPDWYVPLGRISAESGQAYYDLLASMPGIEMRPAWTRSYRPEIIAPHVVGVVGPIPQEEKEEWRAQGYRGDEIVGRMGLERSAERYLAGQRGGRLEIIGADGQTVAVLAERPVRENSSVYTTFDREFQKNVQEILGQRLGAIAVLEVATGRVLALATYPNFDPNLFAAGISEQAWLALQADPQRPLVNRATQGTYPPGSTFKVVTMTAGMEAAGLTGGSTFVCKGTWTGLGPEWPKVCWSRGGHGKIALNRALTVSCDITFYEVGMALQGVGPDVLPDYARRCGFGALSGIEVEEDAGLVPDPAWKLQSQGEGWAPGDTVNLAIGQGFLQVTPLQVAILLAAVGNGGTLYRAQVIEMVAADPASPDLTFQPVAQGELPISADNLAVIRDSLTKVTSDPYGTAYPAFKGLSLPVAGKTGTAESGNPNPHAWFAGYAPAEEPQIAVVVIVENSGQGGSVAAPLFRRVVETYFNIPVAPTATPAPTAAPTSTP